jgi:hypothetical protein
MDPRTVVADGSATPVDVGANHTDPGAIGLAAGVAEFELTDPTVAIRGSATASAPQLVIGLDTRGRAGIAVALTLRDLDSSADAVEPVAVQYRVGRAGDFANVPGGYVADATPAAGVGVAERHVRALLPGAADGKQLLEVRIITTDAVGRDEWVGVDDIEVTATGVTAPGCGAPGPVPAPHPWPVPAPVPGGAAAPTLSELSLTPPTFAAARRGPAIQRRGRAGASLRFRLSKPAVVRFQVRPGSGGVRDRVRFRSRPSADRTRFQVRGRRGRNRMRFSGRIRGRALAEGRYTLSAVAIDRAGRSSAPAVAAFTIGRRAFNSSPQGAGRLIHRARYIKRPIPVAEALAR